MSDVAVTISPTTVVVEDSGVSIQIAGGISYNGATAAIAAEVARAIAAENSLAGTIAMVGANLTQEVTDRESADAAIIASLSVYATTSALTSAINTEIAVRNTAIGVETSRATAAEGTLQSAITAQANVLSWLHMIGDLHFSPTPGSTYFFDNAIVRAYQFNLNGRVILSSDAIDNFAFTGSTGTKYAAFDVSTARTLVIRNIDGDAAITRVGTLLADLAVKVGGGSVSISESPAGAMQFTLPDLSTKIPIYVSGLHLDANNVWESGSLNCQIMSASIALTFQFPAGSFVGFGANKVLNLLSDWSFGWLPTTTGNGTDPSTPSDTLLTRAATGAVSISDRAGHSIGLSAIAPTSSASAGQVGQLAADASFIYRHDGTQWKRSPLTYLTF